MEKMYPTRRRATGAAAAFGLLTNLALAVPVMPASAQASRPAPAPVITAANLESACDPARMQAIATTIASSKVTIRQIEESPKFPGGTKFVAARGVVPAYCQVQGSFVTNPKTGKTANFLATLPANWNGKYLQLGCSGHCGNFAVSDPASSFATITNQGYPGQIMVKGYAAFATDEGHVGMEGGTWAVKGPGLVDEEAIADLYHRADRVLAHMGKEFTVAFYAQTSGTPRRIARAYFNGCSGGGRDAMVAAAYFPEEFDGIVAGSPAYITGVSIQGVGTALATIRSPDAAIPESLLALYNRTVTGQCDKLDGVEDGLIQNPMACDFRPTRDLPRCDGDTPGAACFTKAQADTLDVLLTVVTDEHGSVVQPGYSVSDLQRVWPPKPPRDPAAAEPWPDNAAQDGYLFALGNASIKLFAHRNDPAFASRSIVSFEEGGPGPVPALHIVVPRAEAAFLKAAGEPGSGHDPAKAAKLVKLDRKLLIWHNFSDQVLTPYMSINYYKQLAKRHGGYGKLQKNVRLFMIPGSGHCSMSGVGPNNFDALTAIENWVEKGQAPDALPASLYSEKSPMVDWAKTPLRTMPLCKFPEMARYAGQGDVKDGANWNCPAQDKGLLQIGESGKQAGVIN